jgi:hypothetical protein
MAEVILTEQEKDVVRRYVTAWRRWQPGIRGFASLEDSEMLGSCRRHPRAAGQPVITADAKDPKFFAAIFESDSAAEHDAGELKQARRYVIHGEARCRDSGLWPGSAGQTHP